MNERRAKYYLSMESPWQTTKPMKRDGEVKRWTDRGEAEAIAVLLRVLMPNYTITVEEG